MKIALVCDWLTEIGGAEQVLKTLHEMFPDAPIFTSQYRHKVDGYFNGLPKNLVRTGWLNLLPAASRRFIAPLRQRYFSHLDLTDYDLVISITGCDAKFVQTKPGAHLCYCHIPTQYYWGKYEDYLKNPGFGILNPLARKALKILAPHLRKKDLIAAGNPSHYITISTYSAAEIKKYYKREAKIIAPPVQVKLFQQPVENSKIKKGKCQVKKSEQKFYTVSTPVENSEKTVRFLKKYRGNFYINFSRQVNWKRLDLLVEACKKAKKPLILIGDGPEHKKLVKIAQNCPLILFLPHLPQSDLKIYLSEAKAFLFPSEEPFGIAPVEALAAGCPVIALKSGGALDYISEGKNGLFFANQSVNSIIRAINRFEKLSFSSVAKTALPFSEANFRQKMLQYIYEITEQNPGQDPK